MKFTQEFIVPEKIRFYSDSFTYTLGDTTIFKNLTENNVDFCNWYATKINPETNKNIGNEILIGTSQGVENFEYIFLESGTFKIRLEINYINGLVNSAIIPEYIIIIQTSSLSANFEVIGGILQPHYYVYANDDYVNPAWDFENINVFNIYFTIENEIPVITGHDEIRFKNLSLGNVDHCEWYSIEEWPEWGNTTLLGTTQGLDDFVFPYPYNADVFDIKLKVFDSENNFAEKIIEPYIGISGVTRL
jgi:hypothetical protein